MPKLTPEERQERAFDAATRNVRIVLAVLGMIALSTWGIAGLLEPHVPGNEWLIGLLISFFTVGVTATVGITTYDNKGGFDE